MSFVAVVAAVLVALALWHHARLVLGLILGLGLLAVGVAALGLWIWLVSYLLGLTGHPTNLAFVLMIAIGLPLVSWLSYGRVTDFSSAKSDTPAPDHSARD